MSELARQAIIGQIAAVAAMRLDFGKRPTPPSAPLRSDAELGPGTQNNTGPLA